MKLKRDWHMLYLYFLFFFKIFTYISASGLSCSLQIFLVAAHQLYSVCEVPGQGSNQSPLHWMCVKSLQSFPTLCDPVDCSPPGSSVHGIFSGQSTEWVAMPFSRGSSQHRDGIHISYISCFGKWILYLWRHLGSPLNLWNTREIPGLMF